MWTIEFHPKAQEELNALPSELKEKLLKLLKTAEHEGFLKLPRNSIKHVGNGIRELRVIGKDGIARSLYVTETGQILKVLLTFVKKTAKTPDRIIELAEKRRAE